MPDDRLFHKRAGHSVKVNQLTDFEELTWRYIIESADDFGVLPFDALSLQHEHGRMGARPAKAVQRAMTRVRDVGLVHTFSHQGRAFCYQPHWQDWQKVDYPRTTLNPKPPDEAIAACSAATQLLFAHHPGGWRGKKGAKPSERIPDGAPKHSEGIADTARRLPEHLPKPSGTPTPEPLAVSRKPLAISRQPLAEGPASPAEARSKWPIFKCERFVVFDWQLDDLRQFLGPHFETFGLDEWFYALSARADAEKLTLAKGDVKTWVYNATVEEAERRGLRSPSSSLRPEDFVMTAEEREQVYGRR